MNRIERERRFASIYELYFNDVYRYVYVRTGFREALAEDISQDIFLEVFRGFDRFKGLCSEKTWVMRIAKNKVYDFYRQKMRGSFEIVEMDERTAMNVPDETQDMQRLLENEADQKMVLACLSSLPEHYKMALLLKYVDGMRVKEIAEIAHKTGKSIDNILQRAKLAFIKQYAKLVAEDEK